MPRKSPGSYHAHKIIQDRCIAKKKALGLCKRCKIPKLPESVYCLEHWAYAIINSLINRIDPMQNYRRHEMTRNILQRFNAHPICPYTNEILVPGLTASLDHRIPVSKDKSKALDLDNLEWVAMVYNQAKGNMTTDEFNESYSLTVKSNTNRVIRQHMTKDYRYS